MENEEHQRQVMRVLEKGKKSDRAKSRLSKISELGLVELTRKRNYGSLLKTICEPCMVCEGRGFIKSAESVCIEIFQNIERKAAKIAGKKCLVFASQTVIDSLIDEQACYLRELAILHDSVIACEVEPRYNQDQYDIVVSPLENA